MDAELELWQRFYGCLAAQEKLMIQFLDFFRGSSFFVLKQPTDTAAELFGLRSQRYDAFRAIYFTGVFEFSDLQFYGLRLETFSALRTIIDTGVNDCHLIGLWS